MEENSLKGIYYSDAFTTEEGSPGQPPTDYKRMFIYIDQQNNIYLFHSQKSVSKAIDKFLKNPTKYAEELGEIEETHGIIYLATHPVQNQFETIRYAGEHLSSSELYLEYKSFFKTKTGLQIYLHKYAN